MHFSYNHTRVTTLHFCYNFALVLHVSILITCLLENLRLFWEKLHTNHFWKLQCYAHVLSYLFYEEEYSVGDYIKRCTIFIIKLKQLSLSLTWRIICVSWKKNYGFHNDLVPHPIPKCRERIEFKCSAYEGVIPWALHW